MKRMFKDCRKTYNITLQHVLKNGWHQQEYLLNNFNKNEMKVVLQRMFVAEEGICKHKNWHRLLRTPKVPRQQAVYSLVNMLSAQKTKVKKHLRLAEKYPDARCFRQKLKFKPKFKQKQGWKNDSISIEHVSFQLLPDKKSFSLFKNVDIRDSNVISGTQFYKKKKVEKKNKQKGTRPREIKKRES